MIIDMHGHIFYSNLENDKREVLETIERYHIHCVYLSAIELNNQVPNESEIDEWNSAQYQFEKEHPDCIRSYCRVNFLNKNAVDVAKRGIYDHNVVGLKLLCEAPMDDRRIDPIVEQAILANVPVLIHASHKAPGSPMYPQESNSIHIANLAARYPEAKIIMAHTGGNAYLAVKRVKPYPNVAIDISGSLLRSGTLEYTVKHLGPDRVVFGSDFPYVPHAICAGKVEEADLDPATKEKIWYKNSLRIFDKSWKVGDGQ